MIKRLLPLACACYLMAGCAPRPNSQIDYKKTDNFIQFLAGIQETTFDPILSDGFVVEGKSSSDTALLQYLVGTAKTRLRDDAPQDKERIIYTVVDISGSPSHFGGGQATEGSNTVNITMYLGNSCTSTIVTEVAILEKEREIQVIRRAYRVLWEGGEWKIGPYYLKRTLTSPNPDVKAPGVKKDEARELLAAIQTRQIQESIEILTELADPLHFNTPTPSVRELVDMGPVVLPTVIPLLLDDSWEVRYRAKQVVEAITYQICKIREVDNRFTLLPGKEWDRLWEENGFDIDAPLEVRRASVQKWLNWTARVGAGS